MANTYWDNHAVGEEILRLMALLCQCDVHFEVNPKWGGKDIMRWSFLKRQWFIDPHTGKSYMIHSHLGDNGEIVNDRTDFETVTDLINTVFTE